MPLRFSKKAAAALGFALFFAVFGQAQTGLTLRATVKNLGGDSLWLGRSFGKKAVAERAFSKISEGVFELKLPALPVEPFGAIVFEPTAGAKKAFLTLVFAPGQGDFEVDFDASKKSAQPPVFRHSPENELYQKFEEESETRRKIRDDRQNDFRLSADKASFDALTNAERSLTDFQTRFLREHLQSFAVLAAQAWNFPLAPEPPAGADAAVFRQNWLKKNYLGSADLAAESFWRQPLAIDFLDEFVFKIAPPSADSAIFYADEAFARLAPNAAAQHYYLNYMLNSFESMSRFGFDETVVPLVEKYVKTRRTNGFSEQSRQEKIELAEQIERLRTGKKIPEATLFRLDGTAVELQKIAAPFTLLVFFQPDCSHCKRETKLLKTFYEKYRQRGLQIVLVCGRTGEATSDCEKFRTDFALPDDWLLLADPQMKSDFRRLFKVDGFPRLFLLDAEKRILFRRGGEASEAELEKVFSQNLK